MHDAPDTTTTQADLAAAFWAACHGAPDMLSQLRFDGQGLLRSGFAVDAFASASIAAAGLAVASLRRCMDGSSANAPAVVVDRRLTSLWFGMSIRPQGWKLPPVWDAIAGDYQARDGWIRLHTNAAHHRAAALAVLQTPAQRDAVAAAVATWDADALESAVIAQGGCAGAMRSWQDWQQHPQGQAVLHEPLLHWQTGMQASESGWAFDTHHPLAGIRVLDMTRILAGPVATRLLTSLGAEVLRIDPPQWDEPLLEPEITPGKRCARLDLRQPHERAVWEDLLQGADVLVHGLRSDALDAMGMGAARRQQLRPGLIDVSLDAYGFTGPWKARRGFDSIVQMSMGFAEQAQRSAGADKPVSLPVPALDHATGYLMAAATIRALELRMASGHGSIVRASLARTGALLMGAAMQTRAPAQPALPESPSDWADDVEETPWGRARRVRWPLHVDGVVMGWRTPATTLGSSPAAWAPR